MIISIEKETFILSHMTFDVLSNATTLGHQKAHLSLLNSNISKLIHDQGTLTHPLPPETLGNFFI